MSIYPKSLLNHPNFEAVRPWIAVQVYGRDGGPRKQRRRIELRRDTPANVLSKALQMKVQCPACGDPMKPFRFRTPALRGGDVPQNIYFAAACPERPTGDQLGRWSVLLADPDATKEALHDALSEAVGASKTCCKGGAASAEYEAVIAVVER